MIEEYKPGYQGSATYDHLIGRITLEEYFGYLDRQRAEHGLPPVHRVNLGVLDQPINEEGELAQELGVGSGLSSTDVLRGAEITLEETPDASLL